MIVATVQGIAIVKCHSRWFMFWGWVSTLALSLPLPSLAQITPTASGKRDKHYRHGEWTAV